MPAGRARMANSATALIQIKLWDFIGILLPIRPAILRHEMLTARVSQGMSSETGHVIPRTHLSFKECEQSSNIVRFGDGFLPNTQFPTTDTGSPPFSLPCADIGSAGAGRLIPSVY